MRNYFEFGLDVQKDMQFKDISFLQFGNHLVWLRETFSNFGREQNEEHFCEINLNLDQCFSSKCLFKIFHIMNSSCRIV